MHELAVTQNILDIALEKAEEVQARKITGINLVIGDMAGILDDCVQFYFDFLSKDSIASDALLSFERIHTRFLCRACGHTYQAGDSLPSKCPRCGEWGVEVVAGREFYIDSIEVD
ncbi:MAG: hydrogenase maturation nickel metallochaperone HypA [Dehalococcoidia bacterium]|nr:hydrogenase maturation nickel metallochaperone HypA [Dehalococcoidia bacterium]